jgi:arginyl-tRNA synthetase
MRDLLLEEVRRSVRTAFPEVGEDVLGRLTLEAPRDPSHGDFASNAAFLIKDIVRRNPRQIAEALVKELSGESSVSEAEVAGPGFINFRIRPRGIHSFLERLADPAARTALLHDPDYAAALGRLQIEFVSANPTGPMNVVSARAAAFGDACIRLQRAVGARAEAEFYVNDEGNQAQLFGESLRARFLEAAGRPLELGEESYRGEYVAELARDLWRATCALAAAGRSEEEIVGRIAEGTGSGLTIRELVAESGAFRGESDPAAPEGIVDAIAARVDFSRLGIDSMVEAARAALRSFGVEFDVWFRESVLHRPDAHGEVRLLEAERLLEERGHVREEDGAKWFTSTEYGDDKDRVIRRSNGQATYLLADIAYHLDKARRGFDKVVDVWGPDHHGYIKRLHSATIALGQREDWLEIQIVQQVNLLRGGVPVKMSKRAGELVTLDELVEEVGPDVSRFFFLMRKPSSHLDFDLELAKSETLDNPVFYVQYAHARSRSIFRQPRAQEVLADAVARADLSRLVEPEEMAMMRTLLQYPETVREAARALEPHRVVAYLREVAAAYHRFYTRGKQDAACRVLVEDTETSRARLWLVGVLADVLKEGLGLLGIAALDEM